MGIERKKGEARKVLWVIGIKGYRLLWAMDEIMNQGKEGQEGDFLETALAKIEMKYQKRYSYSKGLRLCGVLFTQRLIKVTESSLRGQAYAPDFLGKNLIANVEQFAKGDAHEWLQYLRPSTTPNVLPVSAMPSSSRPACR